MVVAEPFVVSLDLFRCRLLGPSCCFYRRTSQEFVSFAVEFETLVERRSPLLFDPNVRERIDVRLNFRLKVRRGKVEHICKAKCQKVRRYFSKEFHRLRFVREQLDRVHCIRCDVFHPLNIDNHNRDDRTLVLSNKSVEVHFHRRIVHSVYERSIDEWPPLMFVVPSKALAYALDFAEKSKVEIERVDHAMH